VYFVILCNLCLSFYNYLILFLGFRFWVRSSRSSVRLRALLTEDVVDLDVVWDVVAVVDVVVTWREVTWCRLSMFEIRSSFARPCLKTLRFVVGRDGEKNKNKKMFCFSFFFWRLRTLLRWRDGSLLETERERPSVLSFFFLFSVSVCLFFSLCFLWAARDFFCWTIILRFQKGEWNLRWVLTLVANWANLHYKMATFVFLFKMF
jgi:hypothetical protein